jgi:hypothetical protein
MGPRLNYPLAELEKHSMYDERIYWKINEFIPPMPRLSAGVFGVGL